MKTDKANIRLTIIVIIVLLIVIPLLNIMGRENGGTGIIADQTLNLWGRYLCFAIAALGVDLIWGYTGILSLCQAFFFCLGGYCIGMHMLLMTGARGVYGSTLPDFMVWTQVEKLPLFWEPFHQLPMTLFLIIIVPGVFALIFGFFSFRSRIKGVYFAILTQALALAMWLIFNRNETRLGGTNGLTDFKTLCGFELSEPSTKRGLYIVTVIVLIVIYYFCRYLIKSKLGRILVAIRDSEQRVLFTGYSVWQYKLFVFALAGVIGSIGGMLYVPQTGIITPGRMDVQTSIEMVVWVAVGGRGSLIGAIIGAFTVMMCYSFFTSNFPGQWLYFLGFLFVGVVLFFPKGIVGTAQQLWSKIISKKQ